MHHVVALDLSCEEADGEAETGLEVGSGLAGEHGQDVLGLRVHNNPLLRHQHLMFNLAAIFLSIISSQMHGKKCDSSRFISQEYFMNIFRVLDNIQWVVLYELFLIDNYRRDTPFLVMK